MLSSGFAVRQMAALICAGTLAWDYFRDPEVIGNFALWTLAIHFTYFQLPFKSRALAYIQPVSFIGACLVPIMYIHLWYWNPMLEIKHVETWEVAFSTVAIRAVLVNFLPIVFHILDIMINRTQIIHGFKLKPKKLMLFWSLFSFPMLGLLFELMFPESEETSELVGISRDDFMRQNHYVCLVSLIPSFVSLYLAVLRPAHMHQPAAGSRENSSLPIFPKDSLQNLQQYDNVGRRSVGGVHAHHQ